MIPDFSIGGAAITAAIRKALVSIRLCDKTGMEADQIDIALADPTGRIALPRRGVALAVALGWQDRALTGKGTFIVDEVGEDGPPDVVTIVARSADFRASLKDARDASYNSTTLGAVLAAIAARNGLTPAIHESFAARTIVHLDQTNESDANLITRLGDDNGAIATVKAGRLLFVPAGAGLAASGAALPAIAVARRDGDRHSFRTVDRDGSQTGVQAKWHDLKTARTYFALAGVEGSVKTLKRTYPNREDAQVAADAAWAAIKSKEHELSLTLAVARPDIGAGSPLSLSGWRPEITSIAWITGDVTHTLDADGGFTTDIQATELVGRA